MFTVSLYRRDYHTPLVKMYFLAVIQPSNDPVDLAGRPTYLVNGTPVRRKVIRLMKGYPFTVKLPV